jgi:hypothetical protein
LGSGLVRFSVSSRKWEWRNRRLRPVGGDVFDQALRAVNWEARMLVIGFASGRIQAVPANLILVLAV